MKRRLWAFPAAVAGFLLVAAAGDGLTQPPGGEGKGGKGGFGKGGFGPPGGQQRKILKEYDKNNDGWLNQEERATARAALKQGGGFGGKGGFGGGKGGGFGGKGGERGRPGPKVTPAEVKTFPDAGLYDEGVLRTVFFEFENADWEAGLQDFHGTDVDVPAKVTVDGKTYPLVGVHFRGMSSYGGVPAGSKRSLNVEFDLADPKQKLYGYRTLNLLNGHEDPSFLSTALYSHIARKYTPTPKANMVKVVINGESWVYTNVQQFNKEFLQDNYKTTKGARWKVRGSPGGGGGLDYVGDNVADYKRRYEIKTKDDDAQWKALVDLCRTLSQTPADKLPAALEPILDVDGLLWFLALDVALVNNDGYWVRASDYTIYRDDKGKFHVVPHDMNEAFQVAGGGGPGGGRGPGGGGPGGGPMGGRPLPGEVLPAPVVDMLNLTADQKKQLAELQKDVDGKLDALLTADQRAQFKAIREGGPGGFGPPGGGFGGGPGGGGVTLDPLVALNDARKPLRSKVLAVPAYREKYLRNVRTIATESLDWKTLGPVVANYRGLLEKEVEADTRKLESFDGFKRATDPNATDARGRGMSLRAFADARRKFLLDYPQIKALSP